MSDNEISNYSLLLAAHQKLLETHASLKKEIIERERAQKALRESEANFSEFVAEHRLQG